MFGQGVLEMSDRQFENLLCRDDAIGPGWGGTYVKYTMLEAIEKLRLDVEILTEHAARHLLTDDSGAAVPVHQGETVLIPASARSLAFTPDGGMKILTSWIG